MLDILKRFGAVAITLACVQIDYFALNLALPSMAAGLNTTTTDLQLAVSIYMIAIGIAMVPGSRMADLLGRKKVLLIGIAIFGLSSLWVGLSPNVGSVVAARLIQGLSAGMCFPVSMSLVSNATSQRERLKVLGFITGIAGIGIAAGPVFGGGLAFLVGWRWVFFINVPVALVAVIWGSKQLKEQIDPELASKRLRDFDWLGVFLIAVGVIGISLGIANVPVKGFLASSTLIPLIIGAVMIAIFIYWEKRASWALIPPVLWKNVEFSALVVASTIANMGICAMVFISTIYLQDVRGYSSLVAGLMFIPAAIGLALSGPLSGRLASRFPGKRVMAVTMLAGALSLFILGCVSSSIAFPIVMAFVLLLLGIGSRFGMIVVQSIVKQSQAGAAAGVVLTLMVILGGVAVVIVSAIVKVVGNPLPTQEATTAALLSSGVVIAILALIFGATQWRGAKIHKPNLQEIEVVDESMV